MGNKVVYYDIAVGGKEAATVYAEGDLYTYQDELFANVQPENYATFEGDGTDLTDASLCFPAQSYIGFVSSEVSSDTGAISCTFDIRFGDKSFSGKGITINFHQNYCKSVQIIYYNNNSVVNSSVYTCNELNHFFAKDVAVFDRIYIIFLETELPYQFVKVCGLTLGKVETFTEFYSYNIFEEIAPFCDDLPASTCDFEVKVESVNFEPQEGQTVYAYHKDGLMGKFTIEKCEKVNKNRYRFRCIDDLGVLGDVMLDSEWASGDIFGANGYYAGSYLHYLRFYQNDDTLPAFNYDEIADYILDGFLESNKSMRYHLALVAFACGYCLDSRRGDTLRFFQPYSVNGYKYATPTSTILSGRILNPVTIKKNTPYTKFRFYTYEGDYTDIHKAPVVTTHDVVNPLVPSGLKQKYKEFKAYTVRWRDNQSLRESYISALGFTDTEIKARVILEDEKVGDFVAIEDKEDIMHYGMIKSLDITIHPNRMVADMVIKEVEHYGV